MAGRCQFTIHGDIALSKFWLCQKWKQPDMSDIPRYPPPLGDARQLVCVTSRDWVTALQLIFIAKSKSCQYTMELNARKDITCKWRNHILYNKIMCHLYQPLQTAKMCFEKLLGEQVFKTHNAIQPFQSSPAFFCICLVIYTFFLKI